MKRIIVGLIIFIVAISPLFRGLFFDYETWPFLTVITLLSVVYLLIKIADGESMRFNKWITALGILLILAYALSFINAVNTRENITALIRYTVYFILACILYDYYDNKEKPFALTVMAPVISAGFISAVIGIEALSKAFSVLNVTLNDSEMRIGGTLQYSNTSALHFVLCLLFSLTLMNVLKKPLVSMLFAGVGNTLFLATLLTGSRGGYIVCGLAFLFLIVFQPSEYRIKTLGNVLCITLPAFFFSARISGLAGSGDYMTLTGRLVLSFLIAAMLCAFWHIILRFAARINIRPGLMKLIVFLVVVAIIAAVAAIGVGNLIPQYMIYRFSRLSFTNIRITFMRDSLKLIADNWLLGLGGGGWTSLYHSVQEEFYTARAVHNHYLEVFVESGILGFLSFVGLTLTSLVFWIRSMLKIKDAQKKIIMVGFLCGFLALLIHCSFDFDLTYVSMALLFWVFIAGSAIFHDGAVGSELDKSSAWLIKNKAIKLAGVILGSVVLSVSGLYSASSWHANKGLVSMHRGNIAESRAHYEKARSLDPLNPKYTFELTKIYNHYAEKTSNSEKSRLWRNLAFQSAEEGMALDKYYPAYREMAVRTYLDAGRPVKALERAEELVAYQPCKDSNYELLARSYLEAGMDLLNNGGVEKGRELLALCTQVGDRPDDEVSSTISTYREQALTLLGK